MIKEIVSILMTALVFAVYIELRESKLRKEYEKEIDRLTR